MIDLRGTQQTGLKTSYVPPLRLLGYVLWSRALLYRFNIGELTQTQVRALSPQIFNSLVKLVQLFIL